MVEQAIWDADSWSVRRRRGVVALLSVAVALVTVVPTASGGTAEVSSAGRITYTDELGEENAVTLSSGDLWTITDTTAEIAVGSGCSSVDLHTASCSAPNSAPVEVSVGDFDDTVSIQSSSRATVDGGDGVDVLNGGAGVDIIDGGFGADTLHGGAGVDTATYTLRSMPVSLSLDGIRNDGEPGELDYIDSDVENVRGGAGNDIITGNAASYIHAPSGSAVGNSLYGEGGNDVLDVGPIDGAWDNLFGGEGNDIIKTRDYSGDLTAAADAAYCEIGFDQAIIDFNDVAIDCEAVDSTPYPPLTPQPPPLPAPDTSSPALRIGGSTVQRPVRQRGVLVMVACPAEACTATAKGKVVVRGSAKTFKLTPVTKQIPQGSKAKLKLKLKRKPLSAIGQALRKGKRVTAKVTVTAKDTAGNVTTKRRKIRLKP